MVTAHREAGFTFRVWANDHSPPHVHGWKGGDLVVVNLDPVSVRSCKGMKPADVVRAVAHRGGEPGQDAPALEGNPWLNGG